MQLVERLFACPLFHLLLHRSCAVLHFYCYTSLLAGIRSVHCYSRRENSRCLRGGVISHRRNLLIPPAAVQWQRGKEMDGWVGGWKEQSPDGLSLKRPVCNKSKRVSVSEKLNNTL